MAGRLQREFWIGSNLKIRLDWFSFLQCRAGSNWDRQLFPQTFSAFMLLAAWSQVLPIKKAAWIWRNARSGRVMIDDILRNKVTPIKRDVLGNGPLLDPQGKVGTTCLILDGKCPLERVDTPKPVRISHPRFCLPVETLTNQGTLHTLRRWFNRGFSISLWTIAAAARQRARRTRPSKWPWLF